MSATLSAYQRAVLQEMGITVWREKQAIAPTESADNPENANDKAVEPATPMSREDRLRSLRNTLTDTRPRQAEPSVTQVKALTELETTQAGTLLHDISTAMSGVTGDNNLRVSWQTGESMSVTNNSVTFAKPPHTLTAQDKKQLWQHICRLKP
tara:strand:+ start:103 stop:561 length:459 start_codon:yes stop_codon:yes gene_type:complete